MPVVVKLIDVLMVDDKSGKSEINNALNEGTPLVLTGAAKTQFRFCETKLADNVPVVVTGEPVTENIPGKDSPTEVTVPLPPPPIAVKQPFSSQPSPYPRLTSIG